MITSYISSGWCGADYYEAQIVVRGHGGQRLKSRRILKPAERKLYPNASKIESLVAVRERPGHETRECPMPCCLQEVTIILCANSFLSVTR